MQRSTKRRLIAVLAIAIVGASGCAPERERGAAQTAGEVGDTRIVESQRPAWDREVAWYVAAEPSLEIGVEEGEEPYQFFRVYGALRLDDGRIVVSNSSTGELRFFDPQGRYLMSAGRHGQGPGEFEELSSMRLWRSPEGDLVVTDNRNARMNVFSTAGEFITSHLIEAPPRRRQPNILQSFGDGTWLGVLGAGTHEGAAGQVTRGTTELYRYGDDGGLLNRLAEAPARPRYIHQFGDGIHYPYIPLTAEVSYAAGADRLFIGRGNANEVERRKLDGIVDVLIRWPESERQPTADVYDRYKRESLAGIGDVRRRRMYAHYYDQELPVPEYVPAYEELLVDDQENLWVMDYRLPWDTVPNWKVFDPEGRWLGMVNTPARFTIFQIGDDFILGRHYDELGVERIRLYDLIKP